MFSTKNPTILQNKSLLLFLVTRISITIAVQMLTIGVGWQMYSLTQQPLYLGLVGLVQFLPMFLLTLLVGYIADHFDRRLIICLCQAVESIGVLILAIGSFQGWVTKEVILVLAFVMGTVNAFQGPAMQSLLPNIVSRDFFPRAAALSSSASQCAVILGPAAGGLLYSFGPTVVYSIVAALALCNSVMIYFISISREPVKREPVTVHSLFAGISFIKNKPIILGAISLDLFAVLFGGATALLPIYASKILMIGPFGLGLLRSSPAVGALVMSALLSRKPLTSKVGYKLFASVTVFGLSTMAFAVSTSFVLSFAALVVLGASDVISVVIRHTLVQMETPDHMRGRVSSVNAMFIGTSNQLGEFESGITSAWFGVVPAVLIGGIGTITVVILWMKLFPALFHAEKLKYSES